MAVVLASASPGATEEALAEVFEKHGLEREASEPVAAAVEPLAPVVAEEPHRDEFENEEEFKTAHAEWKKAADEAVQVQEAEDEEAERKVSRFHRRVEKRVARETAALRAEVEALNRRLEEKEAAASGAAPKEKPSENPRPKRADFKVGDDGQQEYEDALLAWGTRDALTKKEQEDAAKAAKAATDAENERLEANYQDYRAQVEEFKEEHDDWDEVVNREDIPMHTAVQLALLEQPNGAECTYYLGKHPEFALKLAELSPLQAVVEVGLLARKLAEPASGRKPSGPATAWGGEPRTPTKPRAPAPVQPVRTSATLASMTSKDAAKARDYKGFKKAQRAGR